MLGRLVIPARNLYEFVVCAFGVYLVTKLSFPPNEPPPNFPFIFGHHEDSDNAKD
jgi:hypothetical protein